jgi:hypothetical protein
MSYIRFGTRWPLLWYCLLLGFHLAVMTDEAVLSGPAGAPRRRPHFDTWRDQSVVFMDTVV